MRNDSQHLRYSKDGMRTIQECNAKLEEDPYNYDALYYRGKLKRKNSNTEGAIADFNQAIGIRDDFTRAFFARAGARFEQRQIFRAASDFFKGLFCLVVDILPTTG